MNQFNMKIVLLIAFCAFCVHAASDQELWNDFKRNHLKTYKNLREEQHRFKIFQSALKEIKEHNIRYKNGEETYAKGINQFSDLTLEEFRQTFLMKEIPQMKISGFFKKPKNAETPDYVNWVEKGVVLPIRDQASCGSCWAFSALGALESQIAIKHNINITLSPQELVDCTLSYSNFGCNGGWPNSSYDYIIEHGIAAEAKYPYLGLNGTCQNQTTTRADVKVRNYIGVAAEDEEALKQAVAHVGPVSVLIVADQIKGYKSGIFDDVSCIGYLDHAVVVVGYGTENGHDYWLIKNSWGARWGEHGYIRMTRNKLNQCGIAAFAVYPVIE